MAKKLLKACICFFIVIWVVMRSPFSLHAGEFRVGTWKTAQTIQPFFYQGFLPETGTLKVFSFTNPADQRVALLARSLDMCGTTLAHAIHSASRGEPVAVVAALCNKCSALVVKRGGHVNKVADLRDKKIGYVPGTMHEILLREVLIRNGLSPDKDVRMTRVDFFDMGMALARGGIDAFLSGEPFPTIALVQGFGTILSYPYYGDSIGAINAGMLVRQETIRNEPHRVGELVLAHAKATEYLKDNKDVWLRKAAEFGTPFEILRKAEPNMELAWKMDASLVEKARALGERMQALGVIDRQPDYEKLFDLSFVKELMARLDLK